MSFSSSISLMCPSTPDNSTSTATASARIAANTTTSSVGEIILSLILTISSHGTNATSSNNSSSELRPISVAHLGGAPRLRLRGGGQQFATRLRHVRRAHRQVYSQHPPKRETTREGVLLSSKRRRRISAQEPSRQ
uniref:Uncharacterized protein n=1 Tax=Timema douglasi TaxID=61478 RepID=A0A7R8VDG1_TIMDO|nr:unnamed protein product [Timema douglasi]